jgi:phosphopantothenoylcysteine decarboxylase/phosphopantothenate--cysteine ligase
MSKSKILFLMSGSIAAYKACSVISKLVQNGFEVQVGATSSALKFVGAATLEGLSGRPIFSDIYEPGQMMDHIHLSRWADLAIVCPASANTLNQLAAGIAENVIGNLFLSYELKRKPFLVAPAMNVEMLHHPATQASLKVLSSWGVEILATGVGYQACGEIGEGRLLEPNEIYTAILKNIQASPSTVQPKEAQI